MHHLGATRSSLKTDHLLQTPDTFIRTPLPGAEGVEFVVHASPQLGARFSQMTAEFVVWRFACACAGTALSLCHRGQTGVEYRR